MRVVLHFLYSSSCFSKFRAADAWGQQLRGPGPLGILGGVVVDEAREPVASVLVFGESSHPRSVGLTGTCYDSAVGMKGRFCDGCLSDAANHVVTDTKGRFDIHDLSRSCISVVTVIGRDGTACRTAIVSIDGLARVVLRWPSRRGALTLHSARILGADGKSLVGATVTVLGLRGTDEALPVGDARGTDSDHRLRRRSYIIPRRLNPPSDRPREGPWRDAFDF